MLKPLGKRVLLAKPAKTEATTKAGILLTEVPKPENVAEVVAIGEEVTSVRVGDQVVFPTYGFIEITDDEVDYLLIEVNDLLAVKE